MSRESIAGALGHWPDFLFWAVLLGVVNLLPVAVDQLSLTVDTPIALAMAFLYPPGLAAAIGFLATMDTREFQGKIDLSRALFNRIHAALSIFVAGAVLHAVVDNADFWWSSFIGAAAAVVVDYIVNVLLVILVQVRDSDFKPRAAIAQLRVGHPGVFLGTYFGYGLLALVVAELFLGVGAWSVIAFLVPILAARQLFVRSQELERLAAMLRRHDLLIQSLFHRMEDERRDERQRIAGDLHDDVLQSLTKIWMLGSLIDKELPESSPGRPDVVELREVADASIDSLRQILHELRESPLGRGGLLPTLESLVRDLRLETKIRIELQVPSQAPHIPPAIQLAAYQVAREALLNSIRHAEASLVRVGVSVRNGELNVSIRDDGRGFSAERVDSGHHFGLGLMRERVQMVGGCLTIDDAGGQGTRVLAKMPLAEHLTKTPQT
jgi:signal transduction histidine kinase